MDPSIAQISTHWARVNANVAEAVKRLSARDLDLRASPGAWPIWAIVAHMATVRIFWLCAILKQPGAGATPLPALSAVTGEGWEDHLDTPRSATELIAGLDSTWQVVADWLERWTPETLRQSFPRHENGSTEWHTHSSILTRLMTHDGYHAGEVLLMLGMHGHKPIDLWSGVEGQPL